MDHNPFQPTPSRCCALLCLSPFSRLFVFLSRHVDSSLRMVGNFLPVLIFLPEPNGGGDRQSAAPSEISVGGMFGLGRSKEALVSLDEVDDEERLKGGRGSIPGSNWFCL